MKPILILLIFSTLAGCSGPTARERMFDELSAQRDIPTPFPTPGKTYASFDVGHGYQVEYLAANGRAYLWYPGNSRVVVGEWKKVLDEICYRYGSNTFNPQTLRRGGGWNCSYIGKLRNFTIGYADGDPFALTTRRVPYILAKCDMPKGIRRLKKVSCTP